MKPLAASTIHAVIAVAAILALALPATVNGQGRFDDYERTPLFDAPPLGGAVGYGVIFGRRGINEDGEWLLHDVVQVYPTLDVAAVWSNGQVRHPFGTAETSFPVAINRRGTVVAGRSSNTLIAERSGRITTVAGRFPVTLNNDDEVLLSGATGANPNKAWIRYLKTGERCPFLAPWTHQGPAHMRQGVARGANILRSILSAVVGAL